MALKFLPGNITPGIGLKQLTWSKTENLLSITAPTRNIAQTQCVSILEQY